MSAGAVPVVIDAAGQIEIVEQGASGYRFAGIDGLVAHTAVRVEKGPDRKDYELTDLGRKALGS